MNKVGRNDPCPCGSARKYKKCCLATISAPPTIVSSGPSPVEPHLPLVASKVFNGERWRAVFDQIHRRPERETFHRFIVNLTRWTFEKKWWERQSSLSPQRQHPVVQWHQAFISLSTKDVTTAQRDARGVPFSPASGPVWALLCFSYDLFCLQARNALPPFMIKRLRDPKQFQAAKYELVAASVMARAGFEIEYLDDKVKNEKHCELIATHRLTGLKVGVEAKSRVRTGVLGAKGNVAASYSEDWKAVKRLVGEAKKQKPDGTPFVIFVDVNAPPTPDLAPIFKPWVQDLKAYVDRPRPITPENPALFNALLVTNFAYHYGKESDRASPAEWAFVPAEHSVTPLTDTTALNAIGESMERYGTIPIEV